MMRFQQVSVAELRDTVKVMNNYGTRPLMAMFANDERGINGAFAIYCVLAEAATGEFILIKGLLEKGMEEFPSLVQVTPAAAWYEREMCDLFGLIPLGHPDLRPLILHENWPVGSYPLRKDFPVAAAVGEALKPYPLPQVEGEGVFEVPVGPIHAGIIEPGHFRFSQAGEHIINLEAKLFFTHRGIEKTVEGLSLEKAFYQIERICGVCTVSHALSFSQAVEGLAEVEISPRARYLRVLTGELERLHNHVGDIGNLCAGLGFATGTSHGARVRETLMRLNEEVAGNRFLRGMVTLGGVNFDIDGHIGREIEKALVLIETDFKDTIQLLRDNDAFLDRVNTTGIVSRQTAVDLALVGVAARASGVNSDLRRNFPYVAYRSLDFKVPVQADGDVASRLWVRVDEIFQSVGLIRQVLDNLPDAKGPLKVVIPPLVPYSSGLGWSESPRGANLHWLMAGPNNTVFRLFVRSASYANWPAVALAVLGNIIPDFPLINKSFELCYACIDR